MIFAMPGTQPILPVVLSLLLVAWLGACTVIDVRTHQVPNWLTLPAIPLALLATWLTWENRAETLGEFLFRLLFLITPLLIAWHNHVLGGADLKILLVLTMANPLLVVAAWLGVIVYFLGLLISQHDRPVRFAGVPGFTLGIGIFTLGQMAIWIHQHLAA